jgi:tetratricopeptide (TPR) repeat protein
VWTAAGKPFKAAEVYKEALESDWAGPKPSPTLLKGLVDALDRDNRYGLSLSYIKSFNEKGYADVVDSQLLEARVYSGWKGHGKDAEEAYQRVIDSNGADFRGYLAKGVFMREIGKPDQADVLFRQAKSLVPKEMAELVSTVIQQAKTQN